MFFKKTLNDKFANNIGGREYNFYTCTECFIDLSKLNLLKISPPWSKSVNQTVGDVLSNFKK